jgi:arylsulfatase A-like enzyme
MLFDVLKARGYRVGVFSSQDERWGNMKSYLWTPSVDAFFEAGEFLESEAGKAEQARFDRARTRAVEGGCLDDRVTVDHALEWLGKAEGPFFLSLNFQLSHFPYTLPPDGVRRYGPAAVDFPMDYAAWPKAKAAEVKGLYDDALGAVDAQLKRVLDTLEAKGLAEKTIVVLTSDHGEAFLEHDASCHANALFEEAVRVPLLVRAPGLEAKTLDVPAQLIDVAPTVAGLLGLPAHPAWQGVDLMRPVPAERDLFLVVHTPLGHQYAVVEGAEKLVVDKDSETTRLYDLAADPHETKDLAIERPMRVKALRARLDSWRAAQLGYYKDPVQQSVSYAPKLVVSGGR